MRSGGPGSAADDVRSQARPPHAGLLVFPAAGVVVLLTAGALRGRARGPAADPAQVPAGSVGSR